ncbi:SDR family NAD(P)-dependent oxidoreductase [Rhabdothermincola salaria]|uniref:SDR family NAD(P)-dependent oxidoreductase n=1 Tax=Rhabdothermincola salaria TaxID=2903142 RepID=UPI001E4124F1|nr:SDR family oxidoreductase [Rhabdothermincola salaria]MCD9622874.1 SDR family oxidoreductase [Rhabdothermincola salaria]
MRGLQDNVIVVAAGGIGASSGGTETASSNRASIGGATCRRLAEEGAKVVVGDIDGAAAQRTVDVIEAAGGQAVAHVFDAAEDDQVAALMAKAVDTYGGIDGLHFNAMDMSARAIGTDSEHDLLTLPVDAWQRTMDVGMTGFLLAARHALPSMLERGGGSIVVTVSGAVYAGEPVRVAYASAKTGMTAIVRHIASRWGRDGVRANAVAPGMVPGPEMLAGLSEENERRMRRASRSHRLGTADDIASAVTFLLSDDAEWINGQVLCVDGGTILRA